MLRLSLIPLLYLLLAALAGCGGHDAAAPSAPAAPLPAAASGRVHTLAVGTSVATPVLQVRAWATLAGGVGPIMEVRLQGRVLGQVEVRSTTPQTYSFNAPGLTAGAMVDVVFTNDAVINGEDRNLNVGYVSDGLTTLSPAGYTVVYDRGTGSKAFDGADVIKGQPGMAWAGALRMPWPAAPAPLAGDTRNQAASTALLLMQGTFGPTDFDLAEAQSLGPAAWVDRQLAQPVAANYVGAVQARYNQGADYRPGGSKYTNEWPARHFWTLAHVAPDQLRQRMVWALHQVFMVSLADGNLWSHSRAYAQYMDLLNRHAFGNFRALLEEMALSPAMGVYLSHIRNRKEDAATGRLPDENFAREVMQLFTIGLHELDLDGTTRKDAAGNPIATYTTADVMALAKVFTGWGWALPDNQLTDSLFRWGGPDYSATGDKLIDLQRMKPYPGQHSTAEKRLFAGKPWALTIPANTSATDSLRLALDVLFKHPNVGPFIGRQLIQRLVSGNPSPAYVARVAAVFNDNGRGVRGDLAAVLRAVLLDAEARTPPADGGGKLREPVLRMAHWMRAMQATSSAGDHMMAGEGTPLLQRALFAPSVFGYTRPGYVPTNTTLATRQQTAPEFQLLSDSTALEWINLAERMSGNGIGWNGASADVSASYTAGAQLSANGDLGALVDHCDRLLLGHRMTPVLRQTIIDALATVGGSDATSHINRARLAVLLTLSTPAYQTQP